jgi:hypothetical protein
MANHGGLGSYFHWNNLNGSSEIPAGATLTGQFTSFQGATYSVPLSAVGQLVSSDSGISYKLARPRLFGRKFSRSPMFVRGWPNENRPTDQSMTLGPVPFQLKASTVGGSTLQITRC